ncbi:hypothetical protein JX266_011423 [Neoarthrinium moseri]|nr:hypothetical protein JX266_011423 [Neoarthrinium moseri]
MAPLSYALDLGAEYLAKDSDGSDQKTLNSFHPLSPTEVLSIERPISTTYLLALSKAADDHFSLERPAGPSRSLQDSTIIPPPVSPFHCDMQAGIANSTIVSITKQDGIMVMALLILAMAVVLIVEVRTALRLQYLERHGTLVSTEETFDESNKSKANSPPQTIV